MLKYILKLAILSLLILQIWGCGTMSKPEEKLFVPKKISIEMPKALQSTKKSVRKKKSLAYTELKEDVEYLENLRTDVEVYLLFLSQVINQVNQRCKNISTNKTCIIPEEELSFIFDKTISNQYTALTHERAEYEIDDILFFGEIKFIKYANNSKYHYHVTMDTSFENEDEYSSETIEWSKDEKNILTIYKEESSTLKSEIQIDYLKKERGEKSIIVNDSYIDKTNNSLDKFHFKLVKKLDVNETYKVISDSETFNHTIEVYSFNSQGELSKNGGFLDFEGVDNGDFFREYETFNGDGSLLNILYCYEELACDMEDKESWVKE